MISLGPTRCARAEQARSPRDEPGLAVRRAGAPREDDLRIFVSLDAWSDLQAHAAGDTTREQGGVLLGRCLADHAGTFLRIEKALPAEAADCRPAHTTFTHETWARIAETLDRSPEKLRIVGWYHTHPGFGVFLSADDRFIHENFFSAPWQVALVIDPVGGRSGFFQWKGNRIEPTGGWYFFAGEEEEKALAEAAEACDLFRVGHAHHVRRHDPRCIHLQRIDEIAIAAPLHPYHRVAIVQFGGPNTVFDMPR